MIQVIAEKCPQNHACPMVKRCRKQAVIQEDFNAPTIDHKKCVECMVCVEICPYGTFEKLE